MSTLGYTRSFLGGLLLGGLLHAAPLAAQDLPGASDWSGRTVLSTPASGLVTRVHVAVGDRVAQGALLLELDPRSYQARLAAAASRLESARLLNEEAQRELARTLELYDRTLISDHDRKLAEIEAAKAAAVLREAEAGLADVRLQRDYSRISAPFAGLVVEVHVQPGQTVINRLQAQPLVTLVEGERMRARAEVDARTLSRLRVGDAVQIGIRGVWLDGVLAVAGYEPVTRGDKGAGYLLEAEFRPTEGMQLRSGEQLVIRLPDE